MGDKKSKVVITSGYRWSYFQWFLLGFYKLEQAGKIKLEFKLPIASKFLTKVNNDVLIRIWNKVKSITETDDYNMDGYIVFPSGEKKYFTIDSADAPYLFDSERLEKVDVYFKMQCPIDLESDVFFLTENIKIPWCDHKHIDKSLTKLTERGERRLCKNYKKYTYKIKPLMVGTRSLSNGNSFLKLNKGYENYIKEYRYIKDKKVMCYFGNALGPKPEVAVVTPDFDWEKDIMGFYAGKISHPNEKRAKVAEYIAAFGDDGDARVISKASADSGLEKDESLVVPLSDFCKHVAKFQYNFNVSGYRMSIPNRFIESLMVGTALITDKLKVRWFLPFDKAEVLETIEMGYLPDKEVDWKTFEKDLKNISNTEPLKIQKFYKEKWEPTKVAEYIIKTVKSVKNEEIK